MVKLLLSQTCVMCFVDPCNVPSAFLSDKFSACHFCQYLVEVIGII